MEDEICPYATFHLLGFREEMDPSKAMQFQTFPHPGNGHSGTMGPPVGHPTNASAHSRSGSQSMVSSFSIGENERFSVALPWRIFMKSVYLANYAHPISESCPLGSSIVRFRSLVRTAAILEYRPKEAAAVLTMSSHPNTTIRPTAHPRKTSMDRSMDNMAHPTIIMDLADLLDVAA